MYGTCINYGADHQAQLLPILCEHHGSVNAKVWKRHFGENNIREFQYLLSKMTWREVLLETEVNAKFEAFMKLIIYSFNTAFPLEIKYRKKPVRNGWITQGVRISSKNMRFFSMIKNRMILTKQTKLYIARYKIVYKRIVKEAKRRENDKFLLNANNKSKAARQITNKETGRTLSKTQDIIISKNSKEISNPEEVAELFNSYFCKIPEKLSNKNGHNTPTFRDYQFKIKDMSNLCFLYQ